MVIKVVVQILCFIALIACQSKPRIDGLWKLEIKLQDQILPVLIQVKQEKDELSATLTNSDEKINLKGGLKDNQFILDFETGYARFKGKIEDDKLVGEWIRTNKEDYKVPFIGVKTTLTTLFNSYRKESNLIDLKGNWKVQLGKDKTGLGVFKQDGARVQGSILTPTGDYRYLDGFIKGNEIKLYGFDGVFSFVFNLIYQDGQLKGDMYSGKSFTQEIQAMVDNEFELIKATEMTKLTSDKPLKFSFPSIKGEIIDLDKGKLKGKAKVIQLFGSWCPNCIDETRFFLEWRKNNQAKLNELEFIAVSFERTKSKQEALKNLKKLSYRIQMDYPIILADFDKSKKVEDIFPIDQMKAYPTTFFLNKENKIVKIHTGFAGQATEMYFEQFKTEFNEIIDTIIN